MYQLDQFEPIARFTADPTVLVVRADAPWKTLRGVRRRRASASRARYNYGSSGNYGTMHVPMEMLKAPAGFRMTHIPFTGAGPAVIALLGGQVDAHCQRTGDRGAAHQRRQGCARSRTGATAARALPDVPSLKELGYAAQFAQWSALFVPAGTPGRDRPAPARRGRRSPPTRSCSNHRRRRQPGRLPRRAAFQAYWDRDAAVMTEAVRRIGKVE